MESKPNERLQLLRERKGFKSAAEFAARYVEQGVKESTYRSWENGTRDLTLAGAKLVAPLLGTTWTWLLQGGPDPMSASDNIKPSERIKSSRPTKAAGPALSNSKIEVLGMAECGPDGWALWNGEVVDYVDRPSNLVGVSKAYAVYVVGDSMEPRYFAGELAFIHPFKPVTIGAFVLMQMVPPHDGEAPRAFLKRLVKRSGDKVTFEQLNPHKIFTLKTSQIQSMHRVVGSGEP